MTYLDTFEIAEANAEAVDTNASSRALLKCLLFGISSAALYMHPNKAEYSA